MSYGQDLLSAYLKILCRYEFIENYRPDILEGLELDFYFPDKKFAIEFQGDQHFFYTTFGSPEKQKINDRRKQTLCRKHGIILKCLEATDLNYMNITAKLKKHKIFWMKRHKKKWSEETCKQRLIELKKLNQKSNEYRKILIKNFSSPTAHRRKSKIREDRKIECHERFGPTSGYVRRTSPRDNTDWLSILKPPVFGNK